MRALIAATILLVAPPAVAAGSNASFEKGGRFVRFDPVVNQYNMSGELFRIDGVCKSACTTFLSIRNVCVSRNATFFFHAGSDRRHSILASATSHMIAAYNPQLANYVISHHYMETLEFHAIPGRDIIDKFGYPECPRTSRR